MSSPVFEERRNAVLEAIAPGVLVLPCAPHPLRNNDVHHGYRQDSDLYYLTGFDEPDSVLVLGAHDAAPAILFVRPRDPEREVWDGARAGVEGAMQHFGIDQAYPIAELQQRLPDLLGGHDRLFYHLGRYSEFDATLIKALAGARSKGRRGKAFPTQIVDSDNVVHELRRIKSAAEIELMQRAVEITDVAHRQAMAAARPGGYEFELEAVLRGAFLRQGSPRVAYEPIVGSGPNATVLHHVKNDRQLRDGDLVLIDAGCEYGYYAADVTRTFPANGSFSAPQRELYQVVLQAQQIAIAACVAGATLDGIHEATLRALVQGMLQVGLLQGSLDQVLETKSYQRYYMHRTSHYLGMDVHDVGRYYVAGSPRPLEAGVVITVEPGLYVAESDQLAPERFRGIGIRIEDDVLIEAQGARVLSASIPKTIDDVEQACRAAPHLSA
jgi:Xaa-Pro aminopeptidase